MDSEVGVEKVRQLDPVGLGHQPEQSAVGAAYAAIPRYPVIWTTIAYVIATLATGNVMLAFAAILLGVLVGLQRRASGGILAPILTHCTWSLAMLILLPLLFG